MLNFYFYNFYTILPFILFFTFLWSFFFGCNSHFYRSVLQVTDILKNSKSIKKINFYFFLRWIFILLLYVFIYFYFLKFDFQIFWFNHLKISNIALNIIFIVMVVCSIFLVIVSFFKNQNNSRSIDFFFSIINLILFILFFFLNNTFYTFFFNLEIISLIVLYKFSVSKLFFNKNIFENNKTLFKSSSFKIFMNTLFFQYWVNFFSSIFLLFVILNLIYTYGSSEWIVLNILCLFNFNFFLVFNFFFSPFYD